MVQKKTTENGVLTAYLSGSLDAVAAPQTEKELKADLKTIRRLVLDMKELRFVSSAGLRMLLKLHKTMRKKDGLIVTNVNESIMQVFALTGFTDILRIE